MIKRGVRIDPAKLGISQNPEADRRQLLERAASKVDAVRGNQMGDGSGALRIRERLNQRGLYLSLNDLMGVPNAPGPTLDRADVFQGMDDGRSFLTEEFPTAHDNFIMEENYATPRRTHPQARAQPSALRAPQAQPVTPARQTLREQIMGGQQPRRPPQPSATVVNPWMVKGFIGETRGGDEVPVWKVSNTKTGSAIGKLFRIESVANRLASFLNESGDINDRRVLGLINLYDKRDQLLKEARGLEKTAAGKPMKSDRLRAIRTEINQLDYRLGI